MSTFEPLLPRTFVKLAARFSEGNNRPFAGKGKNRWYKMVARIGKSVMKLVKLPILRPLLLLKREILWKFKGCVWLAGKPPIFMIDMVT